MNQRASVDYVLEIENRSEHGNLELETFWINGWDIALARRTVTALVRAGMCAARFRFVTVQNSDRKVPGKSGNVIDTSPWHYFGEVMTLDQLEATGDKGAAIAQDIREKYPEQKLVIDGAYTVTLYDEKEDIVLPPVDHELFPAGKFYVEFACLGPLVGDVIHRELQKPFDPDGTYQNLVDNPVMNEDGKTPYAFRIFESLENNKRRYHEKTYYLQGTLCRTDDLKEEDALLKKHLENTETEYAIFLEPGFARGFDPEYDVLLNAEA